MVDRPSSYLVEADSAARRAAASAIGWLVAATTVGMLAQLKLMRPGMLGRLGLVQYGRLRALHDTLAVWGWLSLAGVAVVFAVLPRISGVQLHNERAGRFAAGLWNVLLFAGIPALLLGMNSGRALAELPVGFDAGLMFCMTIVAFLAATTLARRREKTMYVSAWYMLAAVAFLPVVYLLGNLTIFGGTADAIVGNFYVQGVQVLWLLPVFVGAAYFTIPRSTGNPLHSRQLASVGFWSLVLVGGWTGQRAGIFGPFQPYLQTIAIAMSAVLLVPVLSAASNLFQTARGRWSLIADDFGLRFTAVGIGLLAAWTALRAMSSLRPVARVLGLTAWEAGLRHLGLYGAFTALALGALYTLYPLTTGRAWYSRRLSSVHFWTTILGGAGLATVAFVSGFAHGASSLVAGYGGDASHVLQQTSGLAHGFAVLSWLAALVLAAGQWVFAWNAIKTARAGDELAFVAPDLVAAAS